MTNTVNRSADHHYVPKFHLKKFVDVNDKLWRYTRPNQVVHCKKKHFGEAGFEKHLYTRRGIDPADDVCLENRFFEKVDDLAAKVFNRIIANEFRSEKDISDLVIYVRSLMHRTPFDLAGFEAFTIESITRSVQDAGARARCEITAVKVDRLDRTTIESTQPAYGPWAMKNLELLITRSPMVAYLQALDWQILDVAAASCTLVISDNPVVQWGGLEEPAGFVGIALNPTLLLVGAKNMATIQQLASKGVDEIIEMMNSQMICKARKFVATRDMSSDFNISQFFGSGYRESRISELFAEGMPMA